MNRKIKQNDRQVVRQATKRRRAVTSRLAPLAASVQKAEREKKEFGLQICKSHKQNV